MKKANTQSPTSECPPNNNNKHELNLPGNEIKYVRTQSYPSTSRNLVEQVAVSSQQAISDKEYLSHIKRGAVAAASGSGMGRKSSTKDRSLKRQQSVSGEKKTRWLLTRKTWRYMADAGRKLIPDGVQNKPENVEKIEEHFQKLCQNEKKFLIWKRKLSYPGASGSFRRKNKNKVSKRPVTVGSPPTGSSADECEDGERPRKSTDDLIIKMLEKYLNLNSDIEENNDDEGEVTSRRAGVSKNSKNKLNSNKNSRSTNFEGHDQQPSTSGGGSGTHHYHRHLNPPRSLKISSDGNSFTTSTTKTTPDGNDGSMAFSLAAADADSNSDPTRANVQEHSIWHPVSGNDAIHSSLLIDSLKQYRKKNYSPYINSESISGDLLKDKVLLRKILNDIKTQQKYSKTIPRTESTRSLNISYSSSMSSLLTSTISSTFHNFVDFIDTKASSCRNTITRGFGDSNHGHSNVSISAYDSATGKELRQHKSSSSADVIASSSKLSSANVSSAFSVPISRSFNTTTSSMMLSRPHQIYNQQKQIFASQQQQQMYQQQQQYSRSNRTISTTLKTITKTTSTTTISSASKQLPDSSSSNSPSSPASLPGILKKPVKTFKAIEIQTDGIPLNTLNSLFNEYKKQVELERQEEEEQQGEGGRNSGNRKPSIDNKDVSQSVSDTIKRYLMMARKKPKDNDAANKFKRVNYDRNLRNIKAKGEITKPGDDEDLMKGCQTDSDWLEVLFGNSEELHRCYTSPIFSPVVSTPSSNSPPPSIPSSSPPSPAPGSSSGGGGLIQSGTQFLSSLFYHSGANNSNQQQQQSHSPTPSTSSASTVVAGGSSAMQKSKSSSNVGHYVSKKIFRSRSKSQTRSHVSQLLVPASSDVKSQWTPQVSVQKYPSTN
jgi:hypothetical protein